MNDSWGNRAAWLVIVAGIVSTIALQLAVPPVEVFWSGDGGLKNLMAKQFARGDRHVDLRLTDKEWVRELWADGLHPGVHGDYMYDIEGKYYSVFPYPFPLVSAPFYAMFGVRGYYVIPIVSLWVVWLTLYLAMRRACIESWMRALLMAAFIFAMPITLYSATYWEHTLGLALALAGIVYTLRYDDIEPGRFGPFCAGAALGFAVWFRPETLALIAALLPAAFVWRRRTLGVRGWFLFSAGCVGAVALFFAINAGVYGHPLGTHAIQMTSDEHGMTGMHAVLGRFVSLARQCVRFAPLAGFAVLTLCILAWKRSLRVMSEYVYLLVVVAVFFPLMVYMVPTDGGFQIGPRFAFVIFPMLVIACAYQWCAMPRSRSVRAAAIVVLLLTVIVGAKRSAVGETRWMAEQYRNRVLPAYTFLDGRDESVIAASRVEVTLELGGLMGEKDFFAAFDDERFEKLVEGLRKQHIDRFIFVAFGDSNAEEESAIRHETAKSLHIEPLDRHGEHFYCYAVTIP